MVVNKLIKDAFDDSNIPKELTDLINRFLDQEDVGTYSNKQDAIAKLLEDRLTDLKLVDNKELVKWCEDYEG